MDDILIVITGHGPGDRWGYVIITNDINSSTCKGLISDYKEMGAHMSDEIEIYDPQIHGPLSQHTLHSPNLYCTES